MADFEEDLSAGPPPLADGGAVVRETGLAVLHQGERIVSAPDARATIERGSDGLVVNYYFPVEIVIAGSLPEVERELIQARVWESLSDAIERLG